MKRFLLAAVALALAAISVLPAPAPAAPPNPAAPAPHDSPKPAPLPVEVKRDVPYDTIGGQKLYLDVAMPKEGGPYPCVVAFHGGAWMLGSRRELSAGTRAAPSIIERVAARGYVVASVGYRLAPKHPFPAQIEDARAAVRFLRARAKDYRIDRDKFASAGFSAGGHLALLLGLASEVKEWKVGGNLDENARVQCVVDFFCLVPVFGKACKADPDVLKKASPITYVSKDDPPVLMIHGNFDLIVPVVHSERLLKKLKGAGATAELVTVPGEGHGWNGPTLARTLDDSVRFLDEHLKGKK
jgi:acetyl esterase/lipase